MTKNELKFTIEQESDIHHLFFELGWSVRKISAHYGVPADKIVVIIQAA